MNGIRLSALDGLRGVAACVIALLYHPLLNLAPQLAARAPAPIIWLRDWGWTFVDLFFLISGYIFAHVYLRGRQPDRCTLGDFAMARVARLYPLHLATLIVSALVFAGEPGNTWYAFAAHLVMLQAFVAPVTETFNGPSWSISVEVVCYAAFALGVSRGDRALRWITGGAIVLALAHFTLQGRAGGPWAGDCVPRGLLGFFLGQMLWRLRDGLGRAPLALWLVMLVVGLELEMGDASPLLPICLIAWPAALCLALRTRVLAGRAFVWLGDRSYAIYLVHFPLVAPFVPWLAGAREAGAFAAILAAYAILTLVLSDLVHRRFELPARTAIRATWLRRTRGPAQPA